MLMDGLNLLLDRLEQINDPAIHGIVFDLFLVPFSKLLHVDGEGVLLGAVAV